MVARLAPRIGEVDVHAREEVFRDHVAHDLNGIVTHDAHIGERHFIETLRKRAHAGGEDFASEEVDFRVRGSDRTGCFAHAAADLKHNRGFTAECGIEVEELRLILDGVARKRFLESSLLRVRDVPSAHDEAADVALLEFLEFFGRKFLLFHGLSEDGWAKIELAIIPPRALKRDGRYPYICPAR